MSWWELMFSCDDYGQTVLFLSILAKALVYFGLNDNNMDGWLVKFSNKEVELAKPFLPFYIPLLFITMMMSSIFLTLSWAVCHSIFSLQVCYFLLVGVHLGFFFLWSEEDEKKTFIIITRHVNKKHHHHLPFSFPFLLSR